ncbi:MAG: hypothetical protein K1X88_23540 [Nannocystaceae bacterium]|nr:hypothetical protein [Nannocystaceae bacterium]
MRASPLPWIAIATACTAGTPEAERLELPESAAHPRAAAPAIPDDPIARRGVGTCVDAQFPAPQRPRDEGSTMTKTAQLRRFGAIPCAGDREVWLRPDGELDVCTLAAPTTVFGLALAGDNYTHFHPGGRPEQTTLAKPHTLTTKAGVELPCAAEFVALDDAGHVEHCTLARDHAFGDIVCRRGESIALRPTTGTLWACVIDRPFALDGTPIAAGTRVSWHERGTVESVYSPQPLVIDGIAVRYEIALHPDGTLAHYTLDEHRTIGGIALDPFAQVWTYPDGRPWHLEYVAERGFMIHGEPWTDTRSVTFACDGSILRDRTEHFQATSPPRPPR